MKENYFEKVSKLAKEAFKFAKYKKMNKALAVLTFIFLSPVFVAFLALIGVLYVAGFVVDLLESPITKIHNVMREEGQAVKHATQVVVYFFAWPFVFFLECFKAFVDVILRAMYIPTAVVGYVWTLCGYRFHVSIDAEYELPEPEEIKKGRPLAFVIISFVLVLGTVFTGFFTNIMLMIDPNQAMLFTRIVYAYWFPVFKIIFPILCGVTPAFIVLYTLIAYHNKKAVVVKKAAK